MEIKRNDFTEETIYVIQCPLCKEYIETRDDPDYEDYLICEHCNSTLEIIDK